jgi:alkylhydroperoxidase family enzyme
MSTWWTHAATSADVLALRPELARLVRELRHDAEARVPGRLHELLQRRVQRLLGLSHAELPDDLTDAERAAVAVAEQFVLDVHGLSDADFARLGEHFSPAEQLAILIDLALLDGFARLDRVAGVAAPGPQEDR